ncbi:MAG: extracellular solute-binding protein [Caldilineaceae bacterium SB0661_bin_34]|nr:extracellular solute-binding protein [Caldilineaceae bacterium SB0661_bin_34]
MTDRLSRRTFLRVAGGLTALGALAACAMPTAGPASEAEAEQVSVTFYTNDVGWREERYKRIIPDFEAEFPHITVDYTHYTTDWEASLTTWAAGGTMPNVFYSRTQKTSARARLGWILPITGYIDADPDKDLLLDDFWPIQVPQLQYENDWYLIPENISSITMRYQVEALEAAGFSAPDEPWSYYEEWPNVVKELTIRDGDETTQWGFDAGWMFQYSGFAWIWLPAGIVDTDTNTCIIDQPENVKSLNQLQDMRFRDRLIPQSGDIPEGVNMFASGRLAMNMAGVWEITSTRDQVGDMAWDIALIPQNPLNPGENLSINYGAGYAMGAETKHPDAAWDLIRYLSLPSMQQVFIVEDNWALPGRRSVAKDWLNGVLSTGSGMPAHAEHWITALETGRSVPVTAAEKEIEDVYPNLIAPILVTGESRAEEALPHIQAEIQKVLDKYV